jgi:hypothetical protein
MMTAPGDGGMATSARGRAASRSPSNFHKLVLGRDEAIAAWVKHRCPQVSGFGACTAIGVLRCRTIIAGAVFHTYAHPDIQLALAADDGDWCQPGVLAGLFAYPFQQLGCSRISTIAPEGADLTFLHKLGFIEEGRHRKFFADGSTGISFGMVRDECPWLKGSGDAV